MEDNVLQKVFNDIVSDHEDILSKIKEYEIFSEDQILISEKMDLPFQVSASSVNSVLHDTIFFQVIRGQVYFLLMQGMLLCIHSDLLGRKDIDRDVRLASIKSISFEEFIEIVPKEVAKKYLYHIDFFQEHLTVMEL